MYTYTYDNSDRVTGIDYPEIEGENMKDVRFYYDNYGRLSEIKAVMPLLFFDAEKKIREYSYDGRGRISSMKNHYDFGNTVLMSKYVKCDYTYDALGRVADMTYADSWIFHCGGAACPIISEPPLRRI